MPPWNSVSKLSVIIMLTVIDLQFSACKSYYFVVVVCVFSWSHQSCWVILSYAATPSHCGCIQSQSNQSSFDFQTPLCAHTRPLRTGGVLKHRELWKLTHVLQDSSQKLKWSCATFVVHMCSRVATHSISKKLCSDSALIAWRGPGDLESNWPQCHPPNRV